VFYVRGTHEVGEWANVVIVNGDPSADIRVPREVDTVVKGARMVNRSGALLV